MIGKWLPPLLAAVLVSSCTPPTTQVGTVDDRPHLQFSNAPFSAELTLDGTAIGPASAFDGKNKTLVVERGMHRVEVRDGDRILYAENVYLGGDMTKTIDLAR
jgi:hypothetical protein